MTGRTTVYEWSCKNGVATPGRQVSQVDARGFIADIWHVISAEGGAGSQTMPRTGGEPALGGSTGALLVLGAMAALLGLVARRRVHRSTADADLR